MTSAFIMYRHNVHSLQSHLILSAIQKKTLTEVLLSEPLLISLEAIHKLKGIFKNICSLYLYIVFSSCRSEWWHSKVFIKADLVFYLSLFHSLRVYIIWCLFPIQPSLNPSGSCISHFHY